MVTSGTDPKSTNGPDPVDVLTFPNTGRESTLVISNASIYEGWFSVDGGASWSFLPGSETLTIQARFPAGKALKIKRSGRLSAGSNYQELTNVYASVFE